MDKIDVKELKIPNVCFSIIDDEDAEKAEEFKKQRLERGFDDSETWALDYTIARFIIPRLERFIEITDDFIAWDEKDKKLIDDTLKAFKLILKYEDDILTKEEVKFIKETLNKFGDVIFKLWW